jgi:hypothetical protein
VLPEDSAQFAKSKNPLPCQPSGRRIILSRRTSIQSVSRSDDVSYYPDALLSTASSVWTMRTFRPDLPLCREALNCSSLHLSGRFSNTSVRHSVFDKSFRISFQNTDIGRLLPPSGRHRFLSGRTSIRYGNCVHQISRKDDHPSGPDAQSLYLEITCSGRATVRTTGHHRSNAAQKQERISAKFSNN